MKLKSPKNSTFILTFTFMAALCANEAFGAPVDVSESFTYQGRFLSSDGSSALTEVLSLQLSIYDPSAACLLYQESQSVDTSQTNGLFAIDVGSALSDSKRSAVFNNSASLDPGLSMATIFSNQGQIRAAGANCPSGYTPSAGDGRLLRVTVLPAVGSLTTLSPDLGINSVPMAKVAEVAQSVQGYVPGTAANNLVQLDGNAKLPAVDGSQLTNLNVSGSLGFTPAPASGSANYLSPTTAASTYLTQANATSTYEPISGMSSYLTTANAASTYLTQANASSTYLTQSSAASNYVASASAGHYFGGMYSTNTFLGLPGPACGQGATQYQTVYTNPLTSADSCPSGYTQAQILSAQYCQPSIGTYETDIYYCYK